MIQRALSRKRRVVEPATAWDTTNMNTTNTEPSFAETALRLGGKSEEEARRMGAVDKADEQVETLFAPQYQTGQQPDPPAVWDGKVAARPVRAAAAAGRPPRATPPWSKSLAVVRRRREAGTLLDERRQARPTTLLARAGRRPATGACSSTRSTAARARRSPASRRFLTRMATLDPMVAGLASVHGCIGAVDPLRTFGTPEQKAALPAEAGQRRDALRLRPDRARRRLRPDRPAHHGRRSSATTTRSPARSCSSPTPSPAARSAWSCMLDGKPAVLIADLPPQENEQFQIVPLRPVRPAARVQQRPALQQLPRAAGEPAEAADRRRPDHRLPRPEPRPAVAVRRRRRHACASCWPTCCRGPSSAAPTASRSPRASWSSAASPAWPALIAGCRRPGRLGLAG